MAEHDSDTGEPIEGHEPGSAEADDREGPRRLRLHPRQGPEHRFRFARRWESRRRARGSHKIWLLVGLDFGVLLLIYLLTRVVLRKLGVID